MWLFEVLRSEITVIFIIQHQDVTACEMLTSETDLKQMAQSFRNIWTDKHWYAIDIINSLHYLLYYQHITVLST
jgi:hypothetical protein